MTNTTETFLDECPRCEGDWLRPRRIHPMDDPGMCPECYDNFDPTEAELDAYNNRGGWPTERDELAWQALEPWERAMPTLR